VDQPNLGVSREYFIKGLNDSIVESYHKYQVDTAILYGSEPSVAAADMKEALEFENMLAQVSFHFGE
jgi:hypothetical protein